MLIPLIARECDRMSAHVRRLAYRRRPCSSQLLIGLINGAFYALLSLGLAVIFGLHERDQLHAMAPTT